VAKIAPRSIVPHRADRAPWQNQTPSFHPVNENKRTRMHETHRKNTTAYTSMNQHAKRQKEHVICETKMKHAKKHRREMEEQHFSPQILSRQIDSAHRKHKNENH
jgi:hypothetical protein